MSESIYLYEPLWGSWKIDSLIGEGAYGNVYKAFHDEFGFRNESAVKHIAIPDGNYALRCLYSEGADNEQARSLFAECAQSLIKEIHSVLQMKAIPGIVPIDDFKAIERPDKIGFDILIRMDCLKNLTEYSKENLMDARAVAKMGLDISNALVACADRSLVHRSVKPDNIFVSHDGSFKLSDVGISGRIRDSFALYPKEPSALYQAPEEAIGASTSYSADTYSLGLVMYFLLNRKKPPFISPGRAYGLKERREALLRRLEGEDLPPPAEADPRLTEIILKAVSYLPSNRYPAKMLSSDLDYYLTRGRSKTRNNNPANSESASRKDAARTLVREPLSRAAASFAASNNNTIEAIDPSGLISLPEGGIPKAERPESAPNDDIMASKQQTIPYSARGLLDDPTNKDESGLPTFNRQRQRPKFEPSRRHAQVSQNTRVYERPSQASLDQKSWDPPPAPVKPDSAIVAQTQEQSPIRQANPFDNSAVDLMDDLNIPLETILPDKSSSFIMKKDRGAQTEQRLIKKTALSEQQLSDSPAPSEQKPSKEDALIEPQLPKEAAIESMPFMDAAPAETPLSKEAILSGQMLYKAPAIEPRLVNEEAAAKPVNANENAIEAKAADATGSILFRSALPSEIDPLKEATHNGIKQAKEAITAEALPVKEAKIKEVQPDNKEAITSEELPSEKPIASEAQFSYEASIEPQPLKDAPANEPSSTNEGAPSETQPLSEDPPSEQLLAGFPKGPRQSFSHNRKRKLSLENRVPFKIEEEAAVEDFSSPEETEAELTSELFEQLKEITEPETYGEQVTALMALDNNSSVYNANMVEVEDPTLGPWIVTAYFFDDPIISCIGFSMNLTIIASPTGRDSSHKVRKAKFSVFIKNSHGIWVKIGKIKSGQVGKPVFKEFYFRATNVVAFVAVPPNSTIAGTYFYSTSVSGIRRDLLKKGVKNLGSNKSGDSNAPFYS